MDLKELNKLSSMEELLPVKKMNLLNWSKNIKI